MRGRMGVIAMFVTATLVAALIAGGCQHLTPEQKRQRELDKQAAAQAQAEQKRAAADAKAAAAAQKKQAEIDRKNAEAQAKAARKQAADEQKRQAALAKEQQKQAAAQAKADKEAAEQQSAQAKKQSEFAARQQKKQAEMEHKQALALAKEQRKAKPAPAVEMAPMAATAAPVAAAAPATALMPAGPVVDTHSADAMTKLARQGDAYYPDDRLKVIGYPYMKPENQQRLADRIAQAQAAAGQSHDATLSDGDFDGAELNANGRANLALALQYPNPDNQVTIYINTTGGEDVIGGRAAAVERYWKASTWSAVALSTKPGPNPNVSEPANTGLNALRRLERQQSQGGGATATGGDTTGGRSRMGGGAGSTGGAGGGGGL